MQGQAETAGKGEGFSLRGLVGFVLVFAAAGVVLAAAVQTGNSPGTLLQIFTLRFLGIFIEAAPFLLLGTVVSGLIEAFVSPDLILRLFRPKRQGRAILRAAVLGFVFPVCECGVVPVTRRLMSKGMPVSAGVTFLLAAPFLNPIAIASTYIAFGQVSPLILPGRWGITVIVATTIGTIFALGARPQDVLRPQSLAPVMGGSGDLSIVKPQRKALSVGVREALTSATSEFFEMGRYMIVGSLLAAGLQTLVRQETLLALGQGPVVSVLVMQILAFVLSICSTVDAFIALAFFGTFTTGSVLAFLTFGPMVDIKSTLMFLGVFRRRVVLYLILLPFLMTLLLGIWTNLLLRL